MAEALSPPRQPGPGPTRTKFFEDSVRQLIEDRIDYAVTASPDHRNIEAVHFFDESTAQYHGVYLALDSRDDNYLLGISLVKPLAGFDNWLGPRGKRNHVATRRYWHLKSQGLLHQTDGLPHTGSTSVVIPNVDEFSPYTTDPEPVARMQTLMDEIQALRDGEPIKAASITPVFIRTAQIHF